MTAFIFILIYTLSIVFMMYYFFLLYSEKGIFYGQKSTIEEKIAYILAIFVPVLNTICWVFFWAFIYPLKKQ